MQLVGVFNPSTTFTILLTSDLVTFSRSFTLTTLMQANTYILDMLNKCKTGNEMLGLLDAYIAGESARAGYKEPTLDSIDF